MDINKDAEERARLPEEQIKSMFLPEVDWESADIDDDWLDPKDDWETANITLKIGEAPIAMRGGITLYEGQPGNGKSMAMAITAAAVLKKDGGIGAMSRTENVVDPTVLYVDTEMEKYNTQRLQSRIYKLLGWTYHTKHDELRILRLRDTIEVEVILKKIWKAVSVVKPQFCFIDGLLDCVKNFNDNEESSELIRTLGACASHYDLTMFAVIHQNPGTDKSTGHTGSFGERKGFSTMKIWKDKTDPNNPFFHIEQKKARDRDASDFLFRVNDDDDHIGIPEAIEQIPKKEKFTIEECEAYMRGISDKIQWPASIGEIKSAIKDMYGITNNNEQTEITEKAKNKNWLVAQQKAEWVAGQKAAKWNLAIQEVPF